MLKPLGEILQGKRKFIHFQSITPMGDVCFFFFFTSVKGNFTMDKYSTYFHQMIQLTTVFVSYWCYEKNHHKLPGLQHHKFIILRFWSLEF